MSSAILIPASLVQSSSSPIVFLTDPTDSATFLAVYEFDPIDDESEVKLKASGLHTVVFANLTLGAMTGLAGAKQGCSTVLSLKSCEDTKSDIISACKQLGISAYKRPTVSEAVEFAEIVGIPTTYGQMIYRTVLRKILTWVERNMVVGKVDSLVLNRDGTKAGWKMPGSNSVNGYDVQAKHDMGWKRIIDGAVKQVTKAGVWDLASETSSKAARVAKSAAKIPQKSDAASYGQTSTEPSNAAAKNASNRIAAEAKASATQATTTAKAAKASADRATSAAKEAKQTADEAKKGVSFTLGHVEKMSRLLVALSKLGMSHESAINAMKARIEERDSSNQESLDMVVGIIESLAKKAKAAALVKSE